jgi:hypothetical protein
LDALFVVSVPVVALVAVTTAVWAIENDPTLPWFTSLNTALDFWFVSHGVSLEVAKQTLVGIATPAFTFSLPPLGLMLKHLCDAFPVAPFVLEREAGDVGGDGSAAGTLGHPALARAAFAVVQRDFVVRGQLPACVPHTAVAAEKTAVVIA